METLNLKAIKFNGYKIELDVNTQGKPVARFSKFITVGKNKGAYKHMEGFYFATEEKRKTWVENKMTDIKKWDKIAGDKKEAEKKAKETIKNPFEVGQLLYNSWGYEQTNIDFFQIVEVKDRSVMVQKIGQTVVEYVGDMCENVKPNPAKKIGQPFKKLVKVYVGYDGIVNVSVSGLSAYTHGEKGLYQSHYA